VPGSNATTLNHNYNIVGVFTVQVTATDENGLASAPITLSFTVSQAVLKPDPYNPNFRRWFLSLSQV